MIQLDIRPEPLRAAPDDGEHHRQFVPGRSDERFGGAPDPDPGCQCPGLQGREDALVREGSARGAPPCHGFLPDQRHEQVELFLEEGLVLIERVPEQGERLGKGAPPQNDFGPPA
jgi:hypothetical protein